MKGSTYYIRPETGAGGFVEGRVANVIEGVYPTAVPERVMGQVCHVVRGRHSTGTDGSGGFGLERYPLADGSKLCVMARETGTGMDIAWGIITGEGKVKEQGNLHHIKTNETDSQIRKIVMAAERNPESVRRYLIDC